MISDRAKGTSNFAERIIKSELIADAALQNFRAHGKGARLLPADGTSLFCDRRQRLFGLPRSRRKSDLLLRLAFSFKKTATASKSDAGAPAAGCSMMFSQTRSGRSDQLYNIGKITRGLL